MSKDSYNKWTNKKKWLPLTAVGAALLLIPRRSSRKDVNNHNDSNNDYMSNNKLTNINKPKDS